MSALSGEQFEIVSGEQRATVASLGATLCSYSIRGVPLVWGTSTDALPIGSAGQVLAPWPNRLDGGSYDFDGRHAVAAIDEPARNNAIHGLVRWLYWECVDAARDYVRLRCVLAPQPGYPFQVTLSVLYVLGSSGLSVTVEATTECEEAAPFGVGFHPYFLGGPDGLLGARLLMQPARHVQLDARKLPVGDEPLQEEHADLVTADGLLLDGVELDDCFKQLARDPSGVASVRFRPGLGEIHEIVLQLGPGFDFVMCFTGDTLPRDPRRRVVAIEPMSCAPNAFNSGDGLQRVTRDTPFRASFSVAGVLAEC